MRSVFGAHFTPRAYVERLVMPTVIEPLRSDWASVQASALLLAAQELISADRPGIADSSTVVTPKTVQLEVGLERDSNPDVTTTPLLVRYGYAGRRAATAG